LNNMDRKARFHRKAIKVAEAQLLLAQRTQPLGTEVVPLADSSGRRIASDVYSAEPMPHFARSGMDGYALRHEDAAGATPQQPAELQVVGDVPAGNVWTEPLAPGTAVRVMTGAAVPEGATAVVMFEQTDELEHGGQCRVRVKQQAAAGQNIAFPGDEIACGQLLVRSGTRIGPGQAALLAALGHAQVRVFARPRVGIFATGSELLPVEAPLVPGRIRNSNGTMLAAQVELAGGTPVWLGILRDDVIESQARISEALEHIDLLITTGGVSVGDYDAMASLFRMDAHDEFVPLFNKLAMRPGSPTSAALAGGKLHFGLSGNPGACFVGFELLVRPVLLLMQGAGEPHPRRFEAVLAEDYAKGSPHERYHRAKLEFSQGTVYVRPLGFAKSGMMVSIQDADVLAVIPAGSRGAVKGSLVQVIPLD
jgi:molybdopterin molybdotransferase